MNPSELYKQAYNLHYKEGKSEEALTLYNQILNEFPSSKEATYSKSQISNIEGNVQKPKEKQQGHQETERQDTELSEYQVLVEERYPTLRFIASMYKGLAILVGVIVIITMFRSNDNIVLFFGSLVLGAIGVITLLAMSEGIRVFIDIEENTRKFTLQQSKK
ncbi:hypothetical protein Psfp_03632 [Pelotomaculum sp. FP]|uniref:tetratricopeptide repeat protein n=1 Tax=Pelotomaculum sp. FP TaxID=261474 RepID=UPI0010660F0C|nr:tetratricopeptide repeat protein [Pelotomaculum sp. FP]TEB12894.1 hypothetical protein Psfp_03632 [Pelotomaculum sp. FP]